MCKQDLTTQIYLKKEDNKVLSFQKKYKYITSSKQNN